MIHPHGFVLTGLSASGAGEPMDTRLAMNYAYLTYLASGQSAIIKLQASHDTVTWMDVATYTAVTTQVNTSQIAGYYPFVRGVGHLIYSGGGVTASCWMHYGAGLQ
jgi:hypothetical protein